VFENRLELVEQMQCQGFVGKPLVESELLQVLAQVLKLDWVHESRLPSLPLNLGGYSPREPQSLRLPEQLHQAVLHMARLGHASGLRQLLRCAPDEYPTLAKDLHLLKPFVDRFDFESIIACLKEVEDDA
jgi:hypothetical protein